MPYADSDKQRAAQREHARRKRSTGATRGNGRRTESADVEPVVEPLLAPPIQIEKAQDVLDVLSRHMRAVESSKSADALMKARAMSQIASPLLRAIEARDTAIVRDIEGQLENLESEVLEAATEIIARAIRAVLDDMPLTPEQREAAPDIVRRALRRIGMADREAQRVRPRDPQSPPNSEALSRANPVGSPPAIDSSSNQ